MNHVQSTRVKSSYILDMGHLYDGNIAVQCGGVEGLVPHDPPHSADGVPRLAFPLEVVVPQPDGDVIDIECA